MTKINKKLLALCIAIPLIVGALAGLVSGNGIKRYEMMNQPPLSPPQWLFPVVWAILFILMGISSYIIASADISPASKNRLLTVYGVQLAMNFLWTILFFVFSQFLVSFLWLLIILFLVIIMTILFSKVSKTAAYLLIPYILWLAFACYLNLGAYIVN